MLYKLLRREGWPVNRKRVERLYREEGLAVRKKGRKRRSEAPRPIREALGRLNERWSLDFVSDTLSTGRRFRCFMAMDEFNRECVAAEPEVSFPAEKVIEVLERLKEERGLPEVIITDNGPEFRSHAFDAWAYARGIKLEFIQPGKPVQNAFIESLNGTFRDECLNLHWFRNLRDAKERIESWRVQYNQVRPHSSLGDLTPKEFGSAHPEEQERLTITSPVVRE